MKNSQIILLHVLFWGFRIASLFFAFPLAKYLGPKDLLLMRQITLVLPVVFFYLGYFLIMSVKWNRKHLLLIPLLIVIYFVLYLISKEAFAYAVYPLPTIISSVLLGYLFRIFIDWVNKRKDMLVMERENAQSELALLRSQVNPHFLFNTLNNIDTLIYEEKERASQSIEQLSNMMRYMLNKSSEAEVDLEPEIQFLTDYMDLERLRFKNPGFLESSIRGNFKGKKIAPMMLIPFVENAFKHSSDTKEKAAVKIKIDCKMDHLFFHSENIFDTKAQTDMQSGIGLDTVRRRLELIYPGRHKLEIHKENSKFMVSLEITLDEN